MCPPTILKSSSSPKYHPKTNPQLPTDITPWRIRPFGDDGHHRASADTGANEGRNSCRRLRSLLCEPWLRGISLLRRGCSLHCCVSAIQGRPHYRFVWGYGSRGCVCISTTFFFFSIQKQSCLSPSVSFPNTSRFSFFLPKQSRSLPLRKLLPFFHNFLYTNRDKCAILTDGWHSERSYTAYFIYFIFLIRRMAVSSERHKWQQMYLVLSLLCEGRW